MMKAEGMEKEDTAFVNTSGELCIRLNIVTTVARDRIGGSAR